MQLKINVDGQHLKCANPYTAKGAKNFVECAFTFSADWALLDKWALFKVDGGDETYEMEVKENKCIVPSECLQDAGKFILSVVGRDSNNDIVATAASAFAVVLENEFEVGEENRLTVTYLAEVLSKVKKTYNTIIQTNSTAAESANAAAASESSAATYANNAKQSSNSATASATMSKNNADAAISAKNVAVTKAQEAASDAAKAKSYADSAAAITLAAGTIYIDAEGYINILEVANDENTN